MRFKIFLQEMQNDIIAYHGSPQRINSFSTDFLGGGTDQEGPGIYFTTSIEDAGGYGSNIHTVILRPRKLVPLKGKVKINEIKKLILASANLTNEKQLASMDIDAYHDTPLSDWGESPTEAFRNAVNNIIEYSTSPHDTFQNIWISFYRYQPQKYLQQMVELGYDGVKVPRTGLDHYIIFNPNIIVQNN